jgi:hypothetical protein
VKRQVVKLLQEAGLQVQAEGPTLEPSEDGGGQDKASAKQIRKGKPTKRAPLPTLPYPQVTKLVIVFPRPKMAVRIQDYETVLVETDADTEFDVRGQLAIRSEPSCLELAGKSPLRGGRARWRLRPRPTSKAGDVGKVIVTLTKPDGTQLTDSVDFEVLEAVEQKGKKARGFVPPFDIVPINPTDHADTWNIVWPDFPEDASEDQLASVAYKPLPAGGGITVYYSTIFGPFSEQMNKLKQASPALPSLFETNYAIWIGYHAILQDNSRGDDQGGNEGESTEKLLEEERGRVARMQVKQALRTAELMQRARLDQAQEED